MKLERKTICMVRFLIIILILYPSHIFGQTVQPAVAIKKPLVGESVTGTLFYARPARAIFQHHTFLVKKTSSFGNTSP